MFFTVSLVGVNVENEVKNENYHTDVYRLILLRYKVKANDYVGLYWNSTLLIL